MSTHTTTTTKAEIAYVTIIPSRCLKWLFATDHSHIRALAFIIYGALFIAATTSLAAHAVRYSMMKAQSAYDRNSKPSRKPKTFFAVETMDMKSLYAVEIWSAISVLGIFGLMIAHNLFKVMVLDDGCASFIEDTIATFLHIIVACGGIMVISGIVWCLAWVVIKIKGTVDEIPHPYLRLSEKIGELRGAIKEARGNAVALKEEQSRRRQLVKNSRELMVSGAKTVLSEALDDISSHEIGGWRTGVPKLSKRAAIQKITQEDKKQKNEIGLDSIEVPVEMIGHDDLNFGISSTTSSAAFTYKPSLPSPQAPDQIRESKLYRRHASVNAPRRTDPMGLVDILRPAENAAAKREVQGEEAEAVELQSKYIDPDGEARDTGWEGVHEGPEDENWEWLPRRSYPLSTVRPDDGMASMSVESQPVMVRGKTRR